ncbi:helix-hairpin-helix domain-containing protein [Paraburkholderia sp. CNPSo 3274]|uniref:ComEA family DNA-binding protein n=1 Tax=unclassified Paraburkholderia TaxID=2615204 RepID=UPI0020B87D9B|nr:MULTISPECIES: helix-hairpin-helix domain-containing protein [unclassified Paraburkholderia]MCP3706418.1 helix-hairpin-helix domain-containing protein [Paraburkholderia sp. CNPSo 3274]MCP3713815.1 helix-hairpin-helix domain-containing protein [Paraburkholderia sp. CNPSo 3281]
MFRKVLAAAALLAVFSHAFAAVDVNTANEDALRGIKGVGPARAKAILDERSAHGPYKDASDLGKRVKGMGGHTVERLQAEGLAIGPAQPQAAQAKVAQATPAKTGAPQPATVAVKK